MQEYPEEMQYICKKGTVNQEERISESKYKTTVIKLQELKDRQKEMEKEKKDIERKYASIKDVYKQTKVLSEQTKTKLKNLNQEKETSEEVIKALRSMTKTKIDSVPDKEMQIKQLQTSLAKEKKLVERMQEENCLKKTEINITNQKLNTIQQNYENKLKDATKLPDDIKRINKEKEGEQKRLNAEIDYNKKKRLNPQKKTRQNWKNNTVTLNQLT